MTTHIVCDMHYLAYRAYHSVPGLQHDGIGTAVPFGVVRTLIDVWETFGLDSVVSLCFDVGQPLRKNDDPRYKNNRGGEKATEKELEIRAEVRSQITRMREELLPGMGFKNLFWAEGYEADDLIASICNTTQPDDVVIVSNDGDLYQLLSPRVVTYNPTKKEPYTHKRLQADYGCGPELWPKVKALAGCKSDNVVGIHGVGEKTAAKYLTGRVAKGSAAWEKIHPNFELVKDNLKLTRLPYPNTPIVTPVYHELNRFAVRNVLASLGIQSLRV